MWVQMSSGAGPGGASLPGWLSILLGGVERQTCVSGKELQGGVSGGCVAPCRDQ